MNESTRKRVLEKFFSTKTTGKGLGLATVLGVVRRHKGAILVENKPNLGSRFVVLFPTAGRLSEQPSVGRNHQHWRGSGLILLVDDETMVIRVMKRMVELTGFSVLTATSEEEAIQTFSVHADEISAVILDFNMPGMDGKTTLAEDP
ncbi:MAG: response regulator [Proteobacteria bacterium]|nr:response regulator [Pseudomonadota bacterium]